MAPYLRSAQTKQTIIDTACRLFYEKGYTAATVRQICAQSGLSVSRVNYHFSSKADLAGVICGQFFHNFIQQLRRAIGSRNSYSVVNEAIALRFLVQMMLADPETDPFSRFYREIARERILTETFSEVNRQIFSEKAKASMLPGTQLNPARLEVYSRIYAAALPAAIQSWDQVLVQCGGDQKQALSQLQDVFVTLFMQMLDYEHHIQQGILDLSRACYARMDVEAVSLTEVRIHLTGPVSEQDKKGRFAAVLATLSQMENAPLSKFQQHP